MTDEHKIAEQFAPAPVRKPRAKRKTPVVKPQGSRTLVAAVTACVVAVADLILSVRFGIKLF